jgi:hypothetical protein
MTTAEVINRMLRITGIKSLEKLEADDAQAFLDALNSAMSIYYSLIPEAHRKQTFSELLPEKRTVSLELVNGSKAIGGTSPLTAADRWRTIRIDGDDKWNRVNSTTELLDAFEGTTGTVSATVYSDVITLSGVLVERLTSDPRLSTGVVLFHDESLREFRYGYGAPYAIREVYGLDSNRQIGRPRRYWMDVVADRNASAVEPSGFVVVDPIPDTSYTVRFEGLVFPLRYGFDVLQNPQQLPVPQSHIEVGLLPLVYEALVEGGFTLQALPIDLALRRAEKARDFIRTRPAYIGVPYNMMGTPPGY